MLNIISEFIEQLIPALESRRHRACVAIHLDIDSVLNIESLCSVLSAEETLVLSDFIKGAESVRQARNFLGREYRCVIFDAREGIDVDALGAVSGVIRGGGVLVLVLPGLHAWQSAEGRYIKYMRRWLVDQPGIYYFSSPVKMPAPVMMAGTESERTMCEAPFLTLDQQLAVNMLQQGVVQNKNYCAVLTSGRGRGKTVSLGLLTTGLASHDDFRMIITAPRKSVVDPVFEQVRKQFRDCASSSSGLEFNHSRLDFMAPDALLENLPGADVLLVDEAAVIPVSMLRQLLQHYPRIVFCTTTHGYEGTGRGFVLKFYHLLDEQRPGWEKIEMHEPIRWSQHDPLEKWIETLLFLDIRLPQLAHNHLSPDRCDFTRIDRDELVENNALLAEVFSLLVFAHYRTSPSDFQYILDSHDVRIYALRDQSRIVAVLLVNHEGAMTPELSRAIYRGERRPRGHLLAQTLCFHAGDEMAATLRYARVMRLAVHPQIQRNGLGSRLLEQVIEAEKEAGVDIIGSSFSATDELLRFWQKAQMRLLRIGFTRDHVTASSPAVVGYGLTQKGKELISTLSDRFLQNFDIWLSGPLKTLSRSLAHHIQEEAKQYTSQYIASDMDDVISFAHYHRNIEACLPAISRWVSLHHEIMERLEENDQKIISLGIEYAGDWKQIVREMNFKGRHDAEESLRSALRALLEKYGQ